MGDTKQVGSLRWAREGKILGKRRFDVLWIPLLLTFLEETGRREKRAALTQK